MKNRCYPKNTYITHFALSAFLFALAIAILILPLSGYMVVNILFCVILMCMSVACFIIALRNMQYFCFTDGYLIVKWIFGVIVQLELANTAARIENHTTYIRPRKAYLSKDSISLNDMWICIYDNGIKNRPDRWFKSGCSNSKKEKRIQIICTDKNKKLVERYLEINKGKRL